MAALTVLNEYPYYRSPCKGDMLPPRLPAKTIKFVDDCCQWYQKLFPEVRIFEAFKYLHVGMI
jgi:hypothetical protein